MLETRIKIKCPYCKHRQYYPIKINDLFSNIKKIYTCDLDEGGCDKDFVFIGQTKVLHNTFKINYEK